VTDPIARDDYKVDVEVFEGPLDLLLYLIKKDEVDIRDIQIESITGQYMEYLGLMRMLDLNIAGEFIVMAATLMMIKSRLLLPVEERPEMEEEEEDPRWDLVRQLLEYKKFKDAARHLEKRAFVRENMFEKGSELQVAAEPEAAVALQDVSIFDLITALNEALKRVKVEEFGQIYDDQYTVADKIEDVLRRVRGSERVLLSQLFDRMATRHEIICAFLAVLELIRLRQVKVRQGGEFGEIEISRGDEDEAAAAGAVGLAGEVPGEHAGDE
jgi:segregation and condensation protein A